MNEDTLIATTEKEKNRSKSTTNVWKEKQDEMDTIHSISLRLDAEKRIESIKADEEKKRMEREKKAEALANALRQKKRNQELKMIREEEERQQQLAEQEEMKEKGGKKSGKADKRKKSITPPGLNSARSAAIAASAKIARLASKGYAAAKNGSVVYFVFIFQHYLATSLF